VAPRRLSIRRASAERATAADRPGIAQPVPERPVPDHPWPLILGVAFVLFALLLGGWELYWRGKQAIPGYRDDEALWAIQWRRVLREPDSTVLVGSSRTFFDIQLPVWERLSGRRPIQLALVGTSPTFALEQLAEEPVFRGRVLVGIAPDLYFTGYEFLGNVKTYWRKESPSQELGKWLSMRLIEPWFAFYDPDFALFTVYARQPWTDRPGKPFGLRVRKLSVTAADRNNYLWKRLETDAGYRALVQRTWATNFDALTPDEVAHARKATDEALARTATAVAKLRARGVSVLFVREPSTADYLHYEDQWFARHDHWDTLLARTASPGIYFQDYPELSTGYVLPEWSHMTRESAERYTEALYRIIERGFANSQTGRW